MDYTCMIKYQTYEIKMRIPSCKIYKKYFQTHTLSSQIYWEIFQYFSLSLEKPKQETILYSFKNNDEIRPTGWFAGSIGMLTLEKWNIKDIIFDDVYSYEWDIDKVYTDKIPAPKSLLTVTKTLWLRDANYHIEPSESAKQIKFFTDKINKKVYGIIFLNQSLILDLLESVWPIDMAFTYKWEKKVEKISRENFRELFSTLVEAKIFKTWNTLKPKTSYLWFCRYIFWHPQTSSKLCYIYKNSFQTPQIKRPYVLFILPTRK